MKSVKNEKQSNVKVEKVNTQSMKTEEWMIFTKKTRITENSELKFRIEQIGSWSKN